MAVRREKVVLTLEDHFTTEMARAAAATALLDRNLKGLDGSATNVQPSLREVGRESDRMTSSLHRGGAEIDRFSGRVRLMADGLAVIGPSIAPISAVAIPALTGLASQAGFAALGIGSLVVAAQGVGDALKAANEAAIEPTAKNLQKAKEAMAQLGPDAQAFVTRFQEIRPVLADIRDSAAAGWFPGLTESLTSLEQIAPEVASLFESIGRTGGDLVAEGAAAFAGPGWADFRQFVAAEAPKALDDLGRTLGNVARGLAELWQAFGPLNASFSSWLLDASRSFAEWADGLSATEGFQEFVDYIRTNGPRVADALKALGNALVEIIEAVAPLGGPSLKIIETFANAIAAIADSDIGTPILAGVAALALYNRTLQTTTALQARLRLTSPAAVGGGTAVATGVGSKAGLAGVARSAAPAALSLGALALAASDADHSMAGANASAGLLLGSLGGPWGAVVGLATGNLLDFKSELREIDEILRSGDNALAQSALDKRLATLKNPVAFFTGRTQTLAFEDVVSKIQNGQTATQGLALEAGAVKSAGSFSQSGLTTLAKVNKYLADNETASNRAAAATLGLSRSTADLGAAFGVSNAEIARSIVLTDERTNAALGAFNADIQWRTALLAASEQADKSNDGIVGNTKAAVANSGALSNLASAWNNQRDALEANGRSAEAIERKYKIARKAFLDTAEAMEVPRKEAKRLADTLLAIPESITTQVLIEAKIRGALNPFGPQLADGGTVPGLRRPYGDKTLILAAPGEEVITNRNGEADRFRADRDAGRIPAYSAGGRVESSSWSPTSTWTADIDYDRLAAALSKVRPLYGDVHVADGRDFVKTLRDDRRMAAIGGF